MMVKACDWPSLKKIGDLVADRTETEKRLCEIDIRLREMGMGDCTR